MFWGKKKNDALEDRGLLCLSLNVSIGNFNQFIVIQMRRTIEIHSVITSNSALRFNFGNIVNEVQSSTADAGSSFIFANAIVLASAVPYTDGVNPIMTRTITMFGTGAVSAIVNFFYR